jgi:hypothetical protein
MNPAKVIAVAFGLILAPLFSVQGQNAFVGSWVLDPARSQAVSAAFMPAALTVEITDAGGGKYRSVSEGTVGGVSGRNEITFSIDGKDYPVATVPAQPGAPEITQSMERVSDTVYKASSKLGGQLIATALNEISGDGTTLTLTTTGVGQFSALSSTLVFRRK